MKTKRLLLLLVLTLSSFFFFLGNVKADTYTYSSSDFDILQSQGYNDAYAWGLANKPSGYPYMAIKWQNYNTKTQFQISWFSSDSYISSRCDSQFGFDTTYMWGRYNPSTGVGTFVGNGNAYYFAVNQLDNYMYSDISIACPIGTSVTQVFDGITYIADDTHKVLSLQDIVDYPRPTPDNTPLLTSFINVVIDRLTFITSSLHDNYILLSCFTIFTLFFIILLFRRLQ